MYRFVLLLLLSACAPPPKKERQPSAFEQFELSYRDSGAGGLTIAVDSNQVYLSPDKTDPIRYGLLPDSLFSLIQHTVITIRNDTGLRTDDIDCNHCEIIAIEVINGEDTLRFRQTGTPDARLQPLLRGVGTFLRNARHNQRWGYMHFPTWHAIFPPPLAVDIGGRLLP